MHWKNKGVILALLVVVMLFCSFSSVKETEKEITTDKVNEEVKDEVYIDVVSSDSGKAFARTYSTKKQTEGVYYSLYIIEKEDGKWERKTYLRSILMPTAKEKRNGKYRYVSNYSEEIEWLKRGRVYQLIPHNENYHCSVPFWKKPLL